jgi:hypothetical protein
LEQSAEAEATAMVGWLQPGAPPAKSVNETINDTFAGSAPGGPLNVQDPEAWRI